MDEDGHFGILVSVIVGTAISLIVTGIKDLSNDGQLFNGDVSGWEYLGAGLGGAIGGLGTGLGTTLLFGGAGNVISGIFSGDVKSVSDGLIQFTVGAITSGICYGISKGISTRLASSKISNIIGTSTKNSEINANLVKNGFKNMKVGKMGMKAITQKLYEELGYENLQAGIECVLDFGMEFIV